MQSLVVYDSFFGNTEKIAQTIHESLARNLNSELISIKKANPETFKNYDLLIVGSPTRAFSPTPDVKKLLKQIRSKDLCNTQVAAFDTRMEIEKIDSKFLNVMVKIFGYAAKPIANLLVKKGGNLSAPPEGFIVDGEEGPLKSGEMERAAEWSKTLISKKEE